MTQGYTEANNSDSKDQSMKQHRLAAGAARRRWLRVSLVLGSIILCLIVAEAGLRLRQGFKHGVIAVPGWLRQGSPAVADWHPFLRTVPKAPANWVEVQGDNSSVVAINSLGFRSPELERKKPEGTFRIVCIGASAVYDTRVPMDLSWAMQLQNKLQERFPGIRVEVVNAGIPSRTSADSIVNLGLRVLPIDPDVVIIMHGVNDQKPNRHPGFKDDYAHWYRQPAGENIRSFHRLLDRSLLASHIRYRLRFILNPAMKDNWRGEKLKRYDTVGERGLAAYRRNMKSIIGMCAAHDVRVVIATVGHSIDENGDWHAGMDTRNPLVYYHASLTVAGIKDAFQQYNIVNREVAAEHGCALVDIERLLPEGKQNYQDDVHFNQDGAERAAQLFVDEVPWDQWMK